MITAAQEPIAAEFQDRMEFLRRERGSLQCDAGVSRANLEYRTRQFPRWRIALISERGDQLGLLRRSRHRRALGEHAHQPLVLPAVAGCRVASHDVVVEHSIHLPAFRLRQLRQVPAAVQALLLARNGRKHNGCGEFELGEHASALETHGHAGGVVIRSRSGCMRVEHIGTT